MVTTSNELTGYRACLRGGSGNHGALAKRVGNLAAAMQTIVGGNISVLTELCEKARGEAYELLLEHAR
jgi:uncharacterized protein YbjQ (UPF0145 family)